MEITGWTIYLFTRLDSINFLFEVVACITGSLFIIILVNFLITWAEDDTNGKKVCKTGIIFILKILCVTLPIAILTPSTKEMAAIYVIPKIVNNEVVQQLPDELTKLGMEWLQEIRSNKKEK